MQQEETKKTRRIRQVSVTNLFGIFNHVIPLKMDEHITIIHGPNGFGKTVMLNLLHELFSPESGFLQSIPFDEFKVEFEDNTSFWVSKTPQPQSFKGELLPELTIAFHAAGKEPYLLPSPYEADQFSTGYEVFRGKIPKRFNTPDWLVDIRKSVPIRFIETQRLTSYDEEAEGKAADTVTEDSRHLVEVIEKKLAESATLSQSLDRTFPKRVISPTGQQLRVTEDELLDKLQKLEKKRLHLMTIGLLDQETGTESPIDPDQVMEDTTKAVLAVYADDTEQKLRIFDELAQKIDLLTTIINDRFLYKTMAINKKKGFVFTTENGISLALENLSSGEQHELVLLYDLLFRVSPGSLILIDEPELSLHVVWQEQFLKDIQQVTKLTDIDIIIATHSPDIISDRRDLVVELEGPESGGA